MSDNISILCTYELPQSAALDVDKELVVDIVPLISLHSVISVENLNVLAALPAKPNYLICTSVAAINALKAYNITPNSHWHFYCLANATKQALLHAWPTAQIAGTANDALQLTNLIIADKIQEAYFLCSEIRLDIVPKTLAQHQIQLHEIPCYNNVATPVTFEKVYDVLLFCSPSAVASYAQTNVFHAHQHLFAIGNTTANAIKAYTEHLVHIASIPDKLILLQEAITYIKKHKSSEFKERPIT